MKVANMKIEQGFTLYPYNGEDSIILQSDKRICRVNLVTGKGVINATNCNYPNFQKLNIKSLAFDIPTEIRKRVLTHLLENDGKDEVTGGVMRASVSKLPDHLVAVLNKLSEEVARH